MPLTFDEVFNLKESKKYPPLCVRTVKRGFKSVMVCEDCYGNFYRKNQKKICYEMQLMGAVIECDVCSRKRHLHWDIVLRRT